MRSQISFMQYSSDKAEKYGILFKSINSVRYPCTHQSYVCCGKPLEEPNDVYLCGTHNCIKYLCTKI